MIISSDVPDPLAIPGAESLRVQVPKCDIVYPIPHTEARSTLHLGTGDLEGTHSNPRGVFLLPSAFASDLEPHTGREAPWLT